LKVEGKVSDTTSRGKKKADVRRDFSLVNSTVQTIRKDITKMNSTPEQNGSRIKRFRKPERSDVDEALFKWFKQERSDTVPVSGPLVMITFILPKF